MNNRISFTKMSGAGNDFVVINNLDQSIQFPKSNLAVALCSRRFGVGADGLLLLEPSEKVDFAMRYYNADGSYGGMCGNGGRCVAQYAFVKGITARHVMFEALDYVYAADVNGAFVKLRMMDPTDFRLNQLVKTGCEEFSGHYVNTGSPHFVIESSDLDAVEVDRIGRAIRNNLLFAPEGCNVNFVSFDSSNDLSIRTYERGVEAETLACGTGSVASALILAVQRGFSSPIRLNVRSGEQLTVYFDREDGAFKNIVLEGTAHMLFSGNLYYDPESNTILDNPTRTATSADCF